MLLLGHVATSAAFATVIALLEELEDVKCNGKRIIFGDISSQTFIYNTQSMKRVCTSSSTSSNRHCIATSQPNPTNETNGIRCKKKKIELRKLNRIYSRINTLRI